MNLPFHRLLDSKAVLGLWLLLLLILAAGAVGALLSRHAKAAVGSFGLLIALLSVGLWSGLWFQGSLRLGEGEPMTAWENVVAGPWSGTSPITVLYRGEGTGSKALQLVAGGAERQAVVDSSLYLGNGLVSRVTSVAPAPLFVLTDAEGRLLHQGMVKMKRLAGDSEFFRVGVLPHRFYLSWPGVAGEAVAAAAEAPPTLHLRVRRGKLIALDSDLHKGEPVTFESFAFRYEDGVPWIEVEVCRSSLPFLVAICAGLVTVVLAMLTALRNQ
jgi:hypothetical protein